MGSTTLITYLSTIESIITPTNNDDDIQHMIDEFLVFPKLHSEADPSNQVTEEFKSLTNLLNKFIDEGISAGSFEVVADAALIGALFSFGLGAGAWVAAEAIAIGTRIAATQDEKEFQRRVGDIDNELKARLPEKLGKFSILANNNNHYLAGLIPSESAQLARSIFYQFLHHIQLSEHELTVAKFREFGETARKFFNSKEIEAVYDILDRVKDKTDLSEAMKQVNEKLRQISESSSAVMTYAPMVVSFIGGACIMMFSRKFSLTKAELFESGLVEPGNLKVIESMGWVGKVAGAFAVLTAIASAVLSIIAMVDLQNKRHEYQDMLDKAEKAYKDFYSSLISASKDYDKTSGKPVNSTRNSAPELSLAG